MKYLKEQIIPFLRLITETFVIGIAFTLGACVALGIQNTALIIFPADIDQAVQQSLEGMKNG